MTLWARPVGRDTLVTIWVVPNARTTEIVGPHGESLRIRVAAPAEAGRANRELVALVRRRTGAPVDLVRGMGSRRKTLRIRGVTPSTAVRLLEPDLPGEAPHRC